MEFVAGVRQHNLLDYASCEQLNERHDNNFPFIFFSELNILKIMDEYIPGGAFFMLQCD